MHQEEGGELGRLIFLGAQREKQAVDVVRPVERVVFDKVQEYSVAPQEHVKGGTSLTTRKHAQGNPEGDVAMFLVWTLFFSLRRFGYLFHIRIKTRHNTIH